jgi:dipeptidase D
MTRFEEISRIPRCSKKEEAVRLWLTNWAAAAGYEHQTDKAGNLVVRVPSSAGRESSPTVVLQGHMDMVCEKTPGSAHDFSRDPLRLVYEGEWVRAEQTTLGADNGIAIALAMAVSEDLTVDRPPLELLFTVDEESGLSGADQMDPDLIRGRILLNLDSEDEGVFTIGCAGGEELLIDLTVDREDGASGSDGVEIRVGGLRGGHSGIDIQKHRENANCILARVLAKALAIDGVSLVSIDGGSAHNAIPRDSAATVVCRRDAAESLRRAVTEIHERIRSESGEREAGVRISYAALQDGDGDRRPFLPRSAERLVNLLLVLPHGVARMSSEAEGLVETSCNLAVVRTRGNAVQITSSQRSSVMSQLEALNDRVRAAAALAGATVTSANRYPAWQPDPGSQLLEECKRAYRRRYGKEPVVDIIHAGLECGIIGSKVPGMDMISLGPTIRNPHCPEERLHLPSVENTYGFLTELLSSL